MPISLLVVADDSPVYLDMMTERLTEVGFSQQHCVASRHALAAIQQYRPALLLLDINAATACVGWNMLCRLWLTPATRHIPVLVSTTDPRFIRQKATLLRAHRCTIFEKPFELNVLVEMIYSLLGTPIRHARALSKGDWLGGTQLIPVGFLFLITHHSRISE